MPLSGIMRCRDNVRRMEYMILETKKKGNTWILPSGKVHMPVNKSFLGGAKAPRPYEVHMVIAAEQTLQRLTLDVGPTMKVSAMKNAVKSDY